MQPNGAENIGVAGDGNFTLSGGTNTAADLCVGNGFGSSASYTLSGAGLLAGHVEQIAEFGGVGTFVQSGGTNNAHFLTVGQNSGISNSGITINPTGNYTLTAGLLSSGFEMVGDVMGVGGFTQSGGTNTCSLDFEVGSGFIGTYTLSGTGLLTSAAFEGIGTGGSGTFTQSGGTNIASGIWLGEINIGNGTYNLSGGVLALSGSLIGGPGATAFNFTGGNPPGQRDRNGRHRHSAHRRRPPSTPTAIR